MLFSQTIWPKHDISMTLNINFCLHGLNLRNSHGVSFHTSTRFRSTVRRLRVRVPVLSLQRTSIPAISSIAVILFVMAPWIKEKTKVCKHCQSEYVGLMLYCLQNKAQNWRLFLPLNIQSTPFNMREHKYFLTSKMLCDLNYKEMHLLRESMRTNCKCHR